MTDVDAFRDAEYIADVSGISFGGADAVAPGPLPASGQATRVKKLQSAAKVAFIDRLLRDLDIIIYCQLSALYYMDCSLILFAIRAMVQLIFFTPKSPPFDPTRNQPFVCAIFTSNLVCMISHIFFIHPQAGEETRGYLHGGLFLDFIGQKPVPVFRLVSFDILIFLIDLIMLALVIERVKTVESTGSPQTNTETNTDANANSNATQPDTQDHDAEERGVMRGTDSTTSEHDAPANTTPVAEINDDIYDERTTLLADPGDGSSVQSRDGHPLDTFSAGQAVIMDMGFLGTIRDQWKYTTMPQRPTGFVPSPETATFLRQRFGLQVGTDGRIVRLDR
ncbi:hypothetical protein N7532_001904 [Penicillium argentinense]|uniref:DUF1746 domain-containing protein n=1 Tax=Penicillium argentinense TaxID=1131581 RepID=A0A9W9G3E8_9EURO|nr:uncharacterized protein N7532_001904 [Penicillium argentinense]KAJ5111369.1 hypothetical protein N7532_001904 [Penicillium argentinense]